MAIAYDNSSSVTEGVDAATVAWALNNIAGNFVIVGASAQNNLAFTAIKYNSVELTKIPASPITQSDIITWYGYGVSPATGSHNAETIHETTSNVGAAAITFTGVDTSSPINASTEKQGSADDPFHSITTTVADCMLVALIARENSGTLTINTGDGWVVRQEVTVNAQQKFMIATRLVTTATEYTLQTTVGGIDDYVIMLVALAPTSGAQDITLSGLASTSAYGTQSVLLNLDTTGIASTSGFGTQSIWLNLNISGIASIGAIGTQSILLNIDASGIASISAIGTQTLANTQILELSGIASTSVLGTQSILLNLDLTGIPSTSSLGTSSLELNLTLAGIASTGAFGTQSLLLNLDMIGIPSTSAMGTQSVLLNLTLAGIASTVTTGTSGLELNLSLSGISSTGVFGTGVLGFSGEETISLTGISSTTLFGLAELGNVQLILLDGIPNISVFGTSALFDRSFVLVTPVSGAFTQVTD